MGTLRKSSTESFTSHDTIEHINAGSWQRMADAMELMAKNYLDLQRERDQWKASYEDRQISILRIRKSNAALRGHIKRLKSQTLNQAKQDALG